MKFTQTEKKQLMIYVLIAYGITYVLGDIDVVWLWKRFRSQRFSQRSDAVPGSRCDDGISADKKRR